MRFIQIIVFAAAALVCAFAPACAEKRVALVIGNNSYANLPASEQLQKAVNDARAVGGALKSVGFDVIQGENLGRSALLGKFDALVQRLEPGDTAFFFFSGHGVALDGGNYILPADVPNVMAGQEARLKGEALAESYIVGELTGRGVRVAVVVLDACRNNPFARSGKGVGFAKGLSAPPQVSGVFSLYAAAAGQSALDRLSDDDSNPNSVFSRALVPMLTKRGLDLTDLARDVREEVVRIAAAAGYEQRPAYYDETVGGRVYLAGPPPAGNAGREPPPGVQTAATPPAVSDSDRAAQAWEAVKNTTSLKVLDEFIAHFGNVRIYGELARARREEAAKSQVAVVAPVAPPPVISPPPQRDVPLTPDRERGLKIGETFRECADCPEMVVVPSGSFTMGSPDGEEGHGNSESPQHVVTISQPFAVGKFHVTVDEFSAFVREMGHAASIACVKSPSLASVGSWRDPGFVQEGSHPVVCISWNDAQAYVAWMAKKTGRPYRLLTEAEFEYAARAKTSPGSYPRFWFGDESDQCQHGNGADQQTRSVPGTSRWTFASCSDGHAYTSPVGSYRPNAFGLYDMAGNAGQWMEDCWHNNYAGAPSDGSAWTTTCNGSAHVLRGGSWLGHPLDLRAAQRDRVSFPFNDLGFRLARTLEGAK